MVNFRRFNGTSDQITLSLGTAINTITFGTMAVLCRRSDNASWDGPFCTRSSGPDAEMFLDIAPSDQSPPNVLWCSFSGSQNNNGAFTVTAADDWVWVIVTKATGTVAPRYHKYVMSTQTWTRGDGAAGKPNATSPSGGSVQIGTVNNADWFTGDIAAVAVWTTALADAILDSIVNNWTTGVLAASPQAAWLLNQSSTGTSVADAVGTANQTSLSGTSVQSGTIPNWAEAGTTPVSGSDTSTSTETASLLATVAAGSDVASSADVGSLVAAVHGTEVSSVAETGSVIAHLSGADSTAGADSASANNGQHHRPGFAMMLPAGAARLVGGGKVTMVENG